MFDQPDDQNDQNQQQNDNPVADQGQQQNPAAPPADHNFGPKPAYESVFDDQPAGSGSLSPSDDDATSDASPAATTTPQPTAAASPSGPVQDEELIGIKQQALQDLSPLVGKLEQDPEEKFHTTMRIIQASDNHELIKEAYQAAREITDEKVRAQALLDIVNEINYFTKAESSQTEKPE